MMSKRMIWIVAVVAVLALGLGGGATAALIFTEESSAPAPEPPAPEPEVPESSAPTEPPADPVNVPAGLERFYEQVPAWQACGDNECATLTVPVDYAEPDGATIDLNLERVPAADQAQRVGSLLVNPGGPGAPGTSLVEAPGFVFGEPLLQRMDIVAFDPRGTGESAPIDCIPDPELDEYLAQDPTPDDAAEAEAFVAEQRQFFAGCVSSSGELIGHVSTVEAARDMDVMRGALREEQLSYLGFSYGTTLGGVYAELFPANVGRFVLDGATDPTLDFREGSLSQARGFQTALNAYVDNCIDVGDCFLGSTRQEGLDTISGLLDEIEAEPLPTADERDLQIGNAFYGVVTPLYGRSNWPLLDRALEDALAGSGDVLLQLADIYSSRNADGGFGDNSLEAFVSIGCLDDPSAVPVEEVPDEFAAFDEASPTFGRVFAWGMASCLGIQVEAAEPSPTVAAEGAAPILVLGTTRDPATPYEEAVALAEQLDSGVLVSRDGDGHTAYMKDNTCIDTAVEDYLLEGVVPEDGLEC
jgi:pimeloyl-ACP methyl ester carboxylesterase